MDRIRTPLLLAASLQVLTVAGLSFALAQGAARDEIKPPRAEAPRTAERQESSTENEVSSPIDAETRIRARAHYASGVAFEAQGDLAKALAHYTQALQLDPFNWKLAVKVAEKFLEQKHPRKALDALAPSAERPEAPGQVILWRGIAYQAKGEDEKAERDFREALRRSPDLMLAREELVDRYLKTKKPDAALQLLRDTAKIETLASPQLTILAQLYLKYLAADATKQTDLKPEITRILERAVAANTRHPEELLPVADAYAAIANFERAERILKDLLQVTPPIPRIREKLVEVYLRAGKNKAATRELKVLVAENPEHPTAHFLLGSLAADEQRYGDAVKAFEKAIAVRPEFEPPYYDLVGVKLNQRRPVEALEVLAKARLRFAKKFISEFYSGLAYMALRRYAQGLAYLQEAEKLAAKQEPQRLNSFFYFQLGAAFERNEKFAQAEQQFRKCLEQSAKDAEALNYLGYMWAEQGQKLDQASAWIRQAVELQPKNPAFLDSLGWVLFKQGKADEALGWLKKAAEHLEEADPTILEHLGDIYQALGKTTEAAAAWNQSLEIEFNESVWKKLQRATGSPPTPGR